ncbi:MAG: hypothetical protein EOM19_02065, partial [Candidatus Moranbacteria bacterium]|nr:hypothetical protein [Candidatus Moranbacteria bacterium]
MTALEALRKIENERRKVHIDPYTFKHVELDENRIPIAMNVCAGDMGFDDEFEEIEQALKELQELKEELKKREVPMRADNDENYHYFTCPKCGVDWGYSTIP